MDCGKLKWRISIAVAGLLAVGTASCAAPDAPPPLCSTITHESAPFVICTAVLGQHDLRLFYADDGGAPYLDYEPLAGALSANGETLVFAMNGGMYHEDRAPVGLYVDANGEAASLNTNEGPGNFHLLPNGVFVLDDDAATVLETSAYADAYPDELPDYATQSGPLLVIDGALHPAINPDGTSRKRRNGVGVAADGQTVHFVISDVPVTFHQFASVFRDRLETPNALYLDGVVSRLYSEDLGRDERGLDMGPIVGVVR